MEFFTGENLDQADLAGRLDMRAAAGADVHAREGHDAHLARQLLFAAIRDGAERFGVRICDLDRKVSADGLVCLPLDLAKLLRGEQTRKVDGDHLGAHVEAHIVIAEAAVDDAADKMLAAVLLHEVKAPLPVQHAADMRPRCERLLAVVDDLAVPLMGIGNGHAAKRPCVARLAAALGIKRRLVEHHVKAVLSWRAGEHLRIKFPQMGILIIESFRCHIKNCPPQIASFRHFITSPVQMESRRTEKEKARFFG